MTTTPKATILQSLDARSREIFRTVVETYLETGEPVGSRTLSKNGIQLSAASIRNVMSDLSDLGLLDAPHVSAGRMPTHAGLRLFVDGFLEVGDPGKDEQAEIEARLRGAGRDFSGVLKEASTVLSGLAGGAGLVSSPTQDAAVRHVEFVPLSTGEALCVLVTERGDVENRLMKIPPGLPQTALVQAGNYLAAKMTGRTLREAASEIRLEVDERRAELDVAAADLVERGLAEWAGALPGDERGLIIHGRSNLLEDSAATEGMERFRNLLDTLERQKGLLDLLDSAKDAGGVRLFIGSENGLFPLSGSSVIVAPYMNASRQVIGALGVIGPTRLNYARVIPMVDYTARMVGQVLGARDKS